MAIRFDNIEAINLLNNQGEQTIALTNDQGIIVSGNVAMITGNSTGKFAVKSTGVHASYDFYNDGTSYFNGGVTVDAGFSQTGGADASFSGDVIVNGNTQLGNALTDKAVVHGHLGIGEEAYPKIAYPGQNALWSGSGSTTGQIVIDLPGTLGNYDMMYMEIDIYNYSAEGATKLIIGGHNWNSGGNSNTSSLQWYNVNVQVIGALDKPIYFGRRNDGTSERRCIAIGETTSTWSYATVHVSKVHGAEFYNTNIDWIGDWNINQTTSGTYFTKNPTGNFNSGSTLETNGNISASNFSGSSSGTNTGDQTLPTLSSLGAAPLASPALTGTPTAPTAAAATNTTQLATTAFVSTAIANLSDSAPATLNTLNELAAALGDDANFSTTVTNSIATKLPLAGGTMTGNVTFNNSVRELKWNHTSGQSGSRAYGFVGEQGAYGRFALRSSNAADNTLDTDVLYFEADLSATFAGSIDTTDVNIKVGSAIHGTITSSSNSLTLNARNTGKLIFQSGGVEKMRINGTNVGIGEDSPNAKLEVTGDIEDNWAGRFENTNTGGYGILAKIAGTSADERIFEARVGSSTKMLISGDGKATFAGDITTGGDIKIDSTLLSNQENTDVDTGTETIASVAHATYTAAFFDYVIKNGTNVRAGTVYSCHDGTNVEFAETSTVDLGDTSDVTLAVDISGTDMRLRATTTSNNWSVKSLVRAI